jgi:hypothetical protein
VRSAGVVSEAPCRVNELSIRRVRASRTTTNDSPTSTRYASATHING